MALSRGASSSLRALSRSTVASASSQIVSVRRYATEVESGSQFQQPTELPSIYASSSSKNDETGAVIKRYTGKGFPMIPVSDQSQAYREVAVSNAL